MPRTYLVFPKLYNQSSEELTKFLKETVTAWLLGWIYAKDKRNYVCNTLVNESACDRETEFVLEQYRRKRKF